MVNMSWKREGAGGVSYLECTIFEQKREGVVVGDNRGV